MNRFVLSFASVAALVSLCSAGAISWSDRHDLYGGGYNYGLGINGAGVAGGFIGGAGVGGINGGGAGGFIGGGGIGGGAGGFIGGGYGHDYYVRETNHDWNFGGNFSSSLISIRCRLIPSINSITE